MTVSSKNLELLGFHPSKFFFWWACSSARLEQSALNRLAKGSNPFKPASFFFPALFIHKYSRKQNGGDHNDSYENKQGLTLVCECKINIERHYRKKDAIHWPEDKRGLFFSWIYFFPNARLHCNSESFLYLLNIARRVFFQVPFKTTNWFHLLTEQHGGVMY